MKDLRNHPTCLTRRRFLTTAVCSGAALVVTNQLQSGTREAPVIDTHMHVWSDDPERFPYKEGIKLSKVGTMELLLDEMGKNDVDYCVLVQSIHHEWDNRYVAHCLRAQPKRFRVQGLVDPTKAGVEKKLEYWMKEHAFSGVRLRPIYHRGDDEWLTAKSSYPLWETAERLGAIFSFYIGTEQLPKLEVMLKRFPQVPVVIDHLSQIDLKAKDPLPEMKKLLALAPYPQVWVKVSELASVSKSGVYPFSDAYSWVKMVYDAFGPDRLLWGTGYPGPAARAAARRPTVAEELAIIRDKISFFTAEDQAKILGLNAQKLWKFG